MEAALKEAAGAILGDPSRWRWQALDEKEASATLDRLTRATPYGVGGRDGDAPATPPAVGVHLCDLLRRELLRDPRGLEPEELLRAVRLLEDQRQALEPRERQELVQVLTGTNALELVVEFAHDLRSPLTSIMFLAETLRKGQSGEINSLQRDQLGIMYSAALGMVSVVNDVMDLARGEHAAGWGKGNVEAFSIQELVENVRNTIMPMVEQKRLDLAFGTPAHDLR
ncbi:MAG: histidine kinase dimerization/phospho-acceptor domain-containing protein [Gemmatimonadota bacterium]